MQDHRKLKKETHFGIPRPNKFTGCNQCHVQQQLCRMLKMEFYRSYHHISSDDLVSWRLLICFYRYKFQKMPTPWVTGALEENATATWKACSNATTPAAVLSLIKSTKPFRAPMNFTCGPTTFRVKRQSASARAKSGGEEILQIRGKIDHTKTSVWHVFLYFPEAVWDTTEACPEFLGVMQSVSHVGMSTQIPPKFLFQVGIGQKLRDIGRDNLTSIVVTLVGPDDPTQTIVLTSAKIVYSNS